MERIILDNVSKKFWIGVKKNQNSLQQIISLISGREPKKNFFALKEVSFSVHEKEIVGIIGKNGSGKSTLMRIISRIYKKDSGKIFSRGKILPMIGLYLALKPRLTMKDNIFLTGLLVGMSRNEIKMKYKSIVEYAGLGNFEDTKIYQFSEGMKQRLAFSIAIHTDSDIYLLDEVFEVGDEDFKKKSAETLRKKAEKGVSIIFVTHDLEMIKKYCNKVIWLEKGKIKKIGGKEVVEEYGKES